MKKLLLLLSIIFTLGSISVFADDKYISNQDAIKIVKEKADIDWSLIDEDRIIRCEYQGYVRIDQNEHSLIFCIWIPEKNSDNYYSAFFSNGNTYDDTAKNYPWDESLKHYDVEQAKKYAKENGLSEPTEIGAAYMMEGLHAYTYIVKCDNQRYVIPFDQRETNYNIMNNDEVKIEIGKAYRVDKFKEICEREQELYHEYMESLEKKPKPGHYITTDENGDTVESFYEDETVKDEPKTDVTPADKTETKSEDKTESKEDTKSETKSETQPEEKADAPLPSQPAKKEFVDVPATHRAYDGITELADNGVLSGYEDGTFRPGAYVTRAEMSRIISSVTGGLTAETLDSTECDFSDVNTGYWAMNDIIRCKALDLIDGYGDGTFKPNENVSVAEAAKICLSAAGYSSLITENSDTWYTPWIDMAVKYKILDSSDIDPNSKMTRADIAELVSKTINLPLCVFAGYDTSAGAKYQFADGTDGGELRTLLTTYLKK